MSKPASPEATRMVISLVDRSFIIIVILAIVYSGGKADLIWCGKIAAGMIGGMTLIMFAEVVWIKWGRASGTSATQDDT